MIPQNLYSPAAVARLKEYLLDEIKTAEADRKEKEDIWIDCHEAYRAEPLELPADTPEYPFRGSSKLVAKVIATDVETVFARMMGLLFEVPGLFSVKASMPEMVGVAPRIEEFLQWSQENEVDWQSPVGDWILEILKLGTGVLKTRYNREVKKVYEWRELAQGTWQQQAIILLKDAPSVHRVPLFDYFVPSGFRHQKDLPWCAEDIYLTWRQFQGRIGAGIYQSISKVSEAIATSAGSRVETELAKIAGFQQTRGNKLRLTEFWTDWDLGDGYEVAVLCTIERNSGEYVRLDYNPFFNQEPPYATARFMRDENSYYGIGLGEMGLTEQEEISAIRNQRIDNGTVLNSAMVAVRKDNTDIKADEGIYPGKIWRLNNPAQDIQLLSFGGANPVAQSMSTEQSILQMHQIRTGVNDWMAAQQNQTSAYGTAYTYQQLGLNTTKRQGEFLRELRNALSQSGTLVLELYQQFNQRGKEFFALGRQDGMIVRQVLQFPLDLIRRGLKVNVTAIDVATNKDAKIRTNMIAMQSLQQYYAQVLQFLQLAANPMMPQEVKQMCMEAVRGVSLLMEEVLDAYGLQNADEMLPQLAGVLNAQQQRLAAIQQLLASTGAGGNPAAQGPPPQPGMGGVSGLGFPVQGALPAGPQQLGLAGGGIQGAGSLGVR